MINILNLNNALYINQKNIFSPFFRNPKPLWEVLGLEEEYFQNLKNVLKKLSSEMQKSKNLGKKNFELLISSGKELGLDFLQLKNSLADLLKQV